MARVVSVNVGLPRDVPWRGRTVRTGIWKSPVGGRCLVRALNLDGDGQGDLVGHGGEQRAVSVYQMGSYGYWQERLGRTDFVPGQFGENLTVEGLADDDVCVGDRYQIGTAVFEVTQPRVTCYRLGIRMNDSQVPALLTAGGRPGFYLRVLQTGDVGAGDDITKVGEADVRMTIAEVNHLLYSPPHPRDRLERALQIAALSPGWRDSFEALLRDPGDGNSGLAPEAAEHPAAPGFRSLAITALAPESCDVVSVTLRSVDGQPLPAALPGQYVVLKIARAGAPPLFRCYSLCGSPSTSLYRIAVKLEPRGEAGTHVQHARVGDVVEVSAPRGSFVLEPSRRPVVLLSAGIGLTPVLAMLQALAAEPPGRQVLWIHGARDGRHHPFAGEVRGLLRTLGRSYVCYSRPSAPDRKGDDFDAIGRLSRSVFGELHVSREAEIYLCGPRGFMEEMRAALMAYGIPRREIHVETFAGREAVTPGITTAVTRPPHVPADDATTGPCVSFARSGVAAHWNPEKYGSLLELAEACDVPVRWSCRGGVCHTCETGLIQGDVAYAPAPLDAPAESNILPCCARPTRDVVIDL